MSNDYYNSSGTPATRAPGASSPMRAEFSDIEAGFDKLPALTGNANKAVKINAGGTGLTVTNGTITLTGNLSIAGNFSTTGAFNTTLVQQATTTITLPPLTSTLATLALTETLTNKTLTSPTINGATISGTFAGSVTFSGAVTLGSTLTYGGVTLLNSVVGTGSMVLSASPTITGTLTAAAIAASGVITASNTTSAGAIAIDAASGTSRAIYYRTGGLNRWIVQGNATPESGSDAGSNFNIARYDDSGASLGSILTITRSTGLFALTTSVTVSGTLTQTSASATAFASGPNGATNPVFLLVNSTGSQAAGLSITGATSAGTVAAAVISSGANASLSIDAKGSGTITLSSVSTGGIVLADTVTSAPINYAADGQASDTYVITLSPALTAYAAGLMIIFKANTANTGAATLNVNGLGAVTIVKAVSTTLANNDILAGMMCLVYHDGTNFILMNPRAL